MLTGCGQSPLVKFFKEKNLSDRITLCVEEIKSQQQVPFSMEINLLLRAKFYLIQYMCSHLVGYFERNFSDGYSKKVKERFMMTVWENTGLRAC